MGQFLAIGLITEIGIKKEEMEHCNLDIKQIIDEMKKKLHFIPEIFEIYESENNYNFRLKNSTLNKELIPFLEQLYPLLYSDSDDCEYYKDIIIKLKESNPSQCF